MEALQRLHNRGSVSTGFDIDNSCMFDWNGTNNANNSQSYMYDSTWTGTPTSTTTGCFSTWFKNSLSDSTCSEGVASFVNNYSSGNDRSYIMGDWGGTGNFVFGQKVSGAWNFRVVSNNFHRDPSAWYHFFAVWDTSNSTESERIRLYVNGERITSLSAAVYPSQNQECYIVSKEDFSIGRAFSSIYGNFTHGYMAETHFVDGTAYAPTTFGEFDEDSGIWKPKQVSVSYGNKGFYFDYKDASNLGNDVSGNNRDLTLSDIDSSHQATDTPTNNFCTLNILNVEHNGGGNVEYTEGSTKAKALQADEPASGTMAVTKGKWYFECKAFSNSDIMAGWGVPNKWGTSTDNPGNDEYSFGVHSVGRVYYYGNSYVDFSPSVSFDTNDIISVALDADNGFCYWAKNGTWMNGGSPTSGSTGTGGFNYIGGSTGANMKIVDGDFLVPAFRVNYYTNSGIYVNFGGCSTISISSAASDADGYGTFEYAPPSGYYAMCTKNLEEYG